MRRINAANVAVILLSGVVACTKARADAATVVCVNENNAISTLVLDYGADAIGWDGRTFSAHLRKDEIFWSDGVFHHYLNRLTRQLQVKNTLDMPISTYQCERRKF
jgi:hypothetical protein